MAQLLGKGNSCHQVALRKAIPSVQQDRFDHEVFVRTVQVKNVSQLEMDCTWIDKGFQVKKEMDQNGLAMYITGLEMDLERTRVGL